MISPQSFKRLQVIVRGVQDHTCYISHLREQMHSFIRLYRVVQLHGTTSLSSKLLRAAYRLLKGYCTNYYSLYHYLYMYVLHLCILYPIYIIIIITFVSLFYLWGVHTISYFLCQLLCILCYARSIIDKKKQQKKKKHGWSGYVYQATCHWRIIYISTSV